jgi:hypothetical protein
MHKSEDKTRLIVMAVRDMRLSKITIPVLNHQMNIANPSAM